MGNGKVPVLLRAIIGIGIVVKLKDPIVRDFGVLFKETRRRHRCLIEGRNLGKIFANAKVA